MSQGGKTMYDWKNFLVWAYNVAQMSNDPSTQNGAIIVRPVAISSRLRVLGSGWNRFPNGVKETPERWNNKDLKYKLVQHAERDAIAKTLRKWDHGYLDGTTLICPWAACTECAKAILDVGITRLVIHKEAHDRTPANSPWKEDIIVAHMMLREAGVEIVEYSGVVGASPIRHSGKLWNP